MHDDVLDRRVAAARDELAAELRAEAPSIASVEARRRARRQRAAGAISVVALGLAGGVVLAVRTGSDSDVVAGRPASDATTDTSPETPMEYGFAPLTPLLDAKPEPVEETTVHEADGIRMTFWLTADGFGLAEHYPDTGSGAMSGESMYAPALSYMVSSAGPSHPSSVVSGLARPEVASVEWEQQGRSVTVDTFSHPAFPQVRFFYIPVDGTIDHGAAVVRAFAEDGSLLTDTDRINDEYEGFRAAMHERAGVEVVHGRLVTYAGADDTGMSLTLSVRACGSDPRPRWTEADDVIRIRIELVRPRGAGDCTTGAVTEARIGLNEPIGSRSIVDDTTGEPVEGH